MAFVQLAKVWKMFGQFIAVQDFNLEIEEGEFIVIVGPSGCGKTTILRMVAGLEEISRGEIYIGGKKVNDMPAWERDIAMVFQNYALYPHMNVYDNMAFGLRNRKVPAAEIRRRVHEAARLLSIDSLLDHKPKALSGGQQQRVALGRAIVREPRVFLMDEPLSNLDARIRLQMRVELARLQQRLGVTTIYVTHDQVEAMTMGQRIVVMRAGVVQQIDTPMGLYERPTNRFVAGFIGMLPMNFFDVLLEQAEGNLLLKGDGFSFPAPSSLLPDKIKGQENAFVLGIRPEDIVFDAELTQQHPEWVCRVEVEVVEPLGEETLIYFPLGAKSVTARLTGRTVPKPKEMVSVVFNLSHAHLFEREAG